MRLAEDLNSLLRRTHHHQQIYFSRQPEPRHAQLKKQSLAFELWKVSSLRTHESSEHYTHLHSFAKAFDGNDSLHSAAVGRINKRRSNQAHQEAHSVKSILCNTCIPVQCDHASRNKHILLHYPLAPLVGASGCVAAAVSLSLFQFNCSTGVLDAYQLVS